MSDNRHFNQLVAAGRPVGEIVSVNRFLISVKGLQPINAHALVMFEDGSKGFVRQVDEASVQILHLGTASLQVGMTVVEQHNELVTKVGKDFVGRVVGVTGNPLDGKGPIAADAAWPVFNEAPMLYKRELLDKQLATGVTVIDGLFPLVRGQRMALLGDSKSGKSSLATQIVLNQTSTDEIAIYVLIAKRRSDVDALISLLESQDAMKSAIVVVAMMNESLVLSYLAPYVGCALGEYFWQKIGQDVLVIYDDLTSHAEVYREISLLAGASPGRDSYPGDIFFAHSSLLERAGKLAANHKTFTCVPLVLTPGGDITAYLSTNIMSITDGQWILDMNIFRETVRPALSTGLSVTRVGGRGQNQRQQKQSVQALKTLAAYAEAQQFSRFGSEMGAEATRNLARGKNLQELFTQKSNQTFSLTCQQLMLDIILNAKASEIIDVGALKSHVQAFAAKLTDDTNFEQISQDLKTMCLIEQAAPQKEPAEQQAGASK
ncbi:MAG: sodium-transporting two-sector ATPase [Candidatus Saccharimonadales bacterium]